MDDLDIAKKTLVDETFSLVIVNAGRTIYETREYGVRGLVDAIEKNGAGLAGCSVADNVVGRAAAMLCIHCGAAGVYGAMMSEPAKNLLLETGLLVEADTLVPHILNRGLDDVCPFEKLTSQCQTPLECFELIKAKISDK